VEQWDVVFNLNGGGGPWKPVFPLLALLLMFAECVHGKLYQEDWYDGRETAASFGILLGNQLLGVLVAGAVALPAQWLYQHRLADLRMNSGWAWAGLFLAVEFVYYLHHAAMHHVRWFWASHAVHHSATKLNLSCSIRLSWTGQLSGGFLFHLPLVWLGFPAAAVAGMLGLNLGYQFLLHLARAPHLGPLEWVLNTPRHHQVHHASNDACLDKNFGGVLIVFDRLFGTFAAAPRDEPLRYGLKGVVLASQNPFHIVFHEWRLLARDVKRAATFRGRLRALWGLL
jgi:sterol desaturase/sphingolipid hydroxylase (fatty acid hydroxylase superfamily)